MKANSDWEKWSDIAPSACHLCAAGLVSSHWFLLGSILFHTVCGKIRISIYIIQMYSYFELLSFHLGNEACLYAYSNPVFFNQAVPRTTKISASDINARALLRTGGASPWINCWGTQLYPVWKRWWIQNSMQGTDQNITVDIYVNVRQVYLHILEKNHEKVIHMAPFQSKQNSEWIERFQENSSSRRIWKHPSLMQISGLGGWPFFTSRSHFQSHCLVTLHRVAVPVQASYRIFSCATMLSSLLNQTELSSEVRTLTDDQIKSRLIAVHWNCAGQRPLSAIQGEARE